MSDSNGSRSPSFWSKGQTESEEIASLDKFFLNFTPKWFGFIEWLLILGAVEYLMTRIVSQPNNIIITLLEGVSHFFLIFYIQTVLYNFPFYRLLPGKWFKNDQFAYKFSITLAFALVLLIWYIMNGLIRDLAVQ